MKPDTNLKQGNTSSQSVANRESTGRSMPGRSEMLWILAVLGVAVVMYLPTMRHLFARWRLDEQYSLAYLVPFVSGYFTWRLWAEAAHTKRAPSTWGLITIIAALLMHLVSVLLDVVIISDFSILILLVGMCLYARGPVFTRTLWFPLAYMLFAIPIPEGIIDIVGFPMQLWASISTEHLLRLLQIEDVIRNGVNLSIPGFTFSVELACSGMSSLVALVGVTAVFAYITKLPARFKWAIFLLSLPVALAANVVRITTIALVGYEFGGDAAMDIYHDWSSPILFMVAIGLLFLISRGFEWLDARRTTH